MRNRNTPDRLTLLTALAAQELSLSEIARRMQTNKRHVKRWLIDANIAYTHYDNKGDHNGRWHGGWTIDKDGYKLVKVPDHPYCDRHGYVREHRLVMEQHLQRYLTPQEVVHHKQGKLDNHIDNLVLYNSNADHLADTLKGCVPNWTPQGYAKMCAPRKDRQQIPNLDQKEHDALQ